MDYAALRLHLDQPPTRRFDPGEPRGMDLPHDEELLDWIRVGGLLEGMSLRAQLFAGCVAAELVLPIWEEWIRTRSPHPDDGLDEDGRAAIAVAARNAIATVLSGTHPQRCHDAACEESGGSEYALDVAYGRTVDSPDPREDEDGQPVVVDVAARRACDASSAAGSVASAASLIQRAPDSVSVYGSVLRAAKALVDDELAADAVHHAFYARWWSRVRARLALADIASVEFEVLTTEPAVPKPD